MDLDLNAIAGALNIFAGGPCLIVAVICVWRASLLPDGYTWLVVWTALIFTLGGTERLFVGYERFAGELPPPEPNAGFYAAMALRLGFGLAVWVAAGWLIQFFTSGPWSSPLDGYEEDLVEVKETVEDTHQDVEYIKDALQTKTDKVGKKIDELHEVVVEQGEVLEDVHDTVDDVEEKVEDVKEDLQDSDD